MKQRLGPMLEAMATNGVCSVLPAVAATTRGIVRASYGRASTAYLQWRFSAAAGPRQSTLHRMSRSGNIVDRPAPLPLAPSTRHCTNSNEAAHVSRAIRSLESADHQAEFLVLGIETSCDDTGAAVVSADGRILGEAIASQADLLSRWGGVFPKLAQEEHRKFIDKVVADALQTANVKESELSAVAVTIGPGLCPCLHVGVRKARNLARAHQLPLVGVHHMEAHALVVRLLENVEFPFVVLLISGGHNLILLAEGVGEYVQLGTTMDEAVGEAFDKTARLLGLDLTKGGGPALEELARGGNPGAIPLSVPLRGVRYMDCNFSYSGLKNQVRMAIEARKGDEGQIPLLNASAEERQFRADVAASFQRVAIQHLEDKCRRGIEWARKLAPSISSFVVSGGVASNLVVRERLGTLAKEMGLQLVCPPPRLCTDNGVMVAWTGLEHLKLGMFEEPPPVDEPEDIHLDLRPRWQLGDVFAPGLTKARSMKKAGDHPSLTALTREDYTRRKEKVQEASG